MRYHNSNGRYNAAGAANAADFDRMLYGEARTVTRVTVCGGLVYRDTTVTWSRLADEAPQYHRATETVRDGDVTMIQREGGAAPAPRARRVYKEVA